MEQTIERYNYQSPYRNKVVSEKKGLPKIVINFMRQIIASMILFIALFWGHRIELIRSSDIWQNMVYMLGYDMNIEKTKNDFISAISYIREKTPEYFQAINNLYPIDDVNSGNPEDILSNESDMLTQMKQDANDILAATNILRPVPGEATSRYGKRINPITKEEEVHTGVDLRAVSGTEIKSAIQGTVLEVKKNHTSLGNFVRVKNADIITTYAHCSTIEVEEGDKVEQGDIIACSGDTGKTNGPHLHFEITKSGRYVDPGLILPQN